MNLATETLLALLGTRTSEAIRIDQVVDALPGVSPEMARMCLDDLANNLGYTDLSTVLAPGWTGDPADRPHDDVWTLTVEGKRHAVQLGPVFLLASEESRNLESAGIRAGQQVARSSDMPQVPTGRRHAVRTGDPGPVCGTDRQVFRFGFERWPGTAPTAVDKCPACVDAVEVEERRLPTWRAPYRRN